MVQSPLCVSLPRAFETPNMTPAITRLDRWFVSSSWVSESDAGQVNRAEARGYFLSFARNAERSEYHELETNHRSNPGDRRRHIGCLEGSRQRDTERATGPSGAPTFQGGGVSLMDSRAGHHFHTSSEWPATDFSGLDFSKTGRQEVHFTIARDAGNSNAKGFCMMAKAPGSFIL